MRGIKTISISILTIGLLAGSAVGVAAQDERPVFFSWTFGEAEGEFVPGTFDEAPGWMTMRDFMQVDLIEADDERASGLLTVAFNADSWGDPEVNAPEIIEVTSTSQRLVNDGGSWSGTGSAVSHVAAGDGVDPDGAGMVTLTGEDGYEGLTLILLTIPGEDGGTGFILPSVPPVPEPPAE